MTRSAGSSPNQARGGGLRGILGSRASVHARFSRHARPASSRTPPSEGRRSRRYEGWGIHDVASANLLAPDGISLEADGISLFYGPNGSGKTGYVRLLRCLFRARGYNSVLPNVFLEDAGTPRATITLSYGAVTEPVAWDAATDADLELTGAAIFDESASSTYLSGDTQVWYTPSGLDVLNSLATVMDWVQEQLMTERKGPLPAARLPGRGARQRLRSATANTERR